MNRVIFFALGSVFLVIGIAGLILPGLPGTFPLILSAGFFAKSDPRIEKWMLEHPHIGPPIKSWRAEGSISMKHKILAVTMLWCSTALACYFAPWWSAIIAIICAIGVSIYIITRPTRLA